MCCDWLYSPLGYFLAVPSGEGGQVWIVGHSFVHWAERHPLAGTASELLGGRLVRWLGVRGMRWSGFLDLVFSKEPIWGRPQWLGVHLGGNDLGQLKGFRLSSRIRADLQRVINRWPEVRVVWSDIVPRQVWRGARDVRVIDKARRKVNIRVSRWLLARGGVAVRHPLLVLGSSQFFSTDGVHLSRQGTEVLLERIFAAIR